MSHTNFIRNSLGDLLVVILLYFIVKIFVDSPKKVAIGVFIFACFTEFIQFIKLADILGFQKGSIPYIVIGNTFSWSDIIMYTIGCITAYFIDKKWII